MPSVHTSHTQSIAIDDPHKLIKVVASDGKSGDQKEVTYTNCKVIGNGSFGIVFQARLVGGSKDGDDIAIKKVLQDKRFKVRCPFFSFFSLACPAPAFPFRVWSCVSQQPSSAHPLTSLRTHTHRIVNSKS